MKKEIYPGIMIHTVQNQMDNILRRLHSDHLCSCSQSRQMQWYPQVDIYETEENLVLLAECAGVEKDDLEITVEDKILTLKGKRRDPLVGCGRKKAHNMEITYGRFKRSVTIDIPIDQKKIKASFSNGFLTLTIPKAAQEPRVIQIQPDSTDSSET